MDSERILHKTIEQLREDSRRLAELEAENAQLRKSARLPLIRQDREHLAHLESENAFAKRVLRGCLGHFYEETPLSTIAKDVSGAFHRGQHNRQQLRSELTDLRDLRTRLCDELCLHGSTDEELVATVRAFVEQLSKMVAALEAVRREKQLHGQVVDAMCEVRAVLAECEGVTAQETEELGGGA